MKKLIFATKNKGKLKEFKSMVADLDLEVFSLQDFPEIPTIEETGSTFEENSLIKARTVFQATEAMVVADDSGLEVACLNNAPGVYSARYAGEISNDALNNQKLLKELQTVPFARRKACFRTVITLIDEKGKVYKCEGICSGYITEAMSGENGFGYDPLFYLPEYKKTMAELDINEKNKISHRGQAFQKVKSVLVKMQNNADK